MKPTKPKPHPVYPMGATVTFADDVATVSLAKMGNVTVLASGIVNGKPVTDDAGRVLYIPCWCEREGREATTIYVGVGNIVEVKR